MPTARSPPHHGFQKVHGSNTPVLERTSTLMANDRISDFLAAVDNLRGDDETVRTTAHTSSVSAEGWPTTAAPTDTATPTAPAGPGA
ncbi:hypothetical protein ACIHCQ_43915 [Streptomyces sp. NPDC052236]|uniref:hypothetical protein n=1 Tax=Streptomyces sp. NPDC052236 TaxID=3365686 RepID=UPI0037CF8987